MPTPYINRASLSALVGANVLERAEADTAADVDAVIAAVCAVADGYVASQVALPPSDLARAQVAPIVAELVICTLFANDQSDHTAKRRDSALKQLREIADSTVKLHVNAPVDDPATPEDERLSGASAFGGSPRVFAGRTNYFG